MARIVETYEAAAGGCCGGAGGAQTSPTADGAHPAGGSDAALMVQTAADGARRLDLIVENMTCAACINTIERTVRAIPGVESARVNFSTRRLSTTWRPAPADADRMAEPAESDRETADAIVLSLNHRGYRVVPFDAKALATGTADGARAGIGEEQRLLRALGVAGFAAANIMLLSISVWAGSASDMDPATRDLFHWVAAIIALPTVAYAIQPFLHSALQALAGRRLNMDVPITLAVLLATGMSLYQTAQGGHDVYFDASVTLLFFLLIGRFLDVRVRGKARAVAENLLALRSRAATVLEADGTTRFVRPEALEPGMRVLVAAGERIPADGALASARASVDASLLTGESLPQTVTAGDPVYTGMVNLTGPLELTVTSTADKSLLAEIVRLMETAEQGRARYVRLADRVAQAYAPAVHLLGLVTFLAWMVLGAGWETALMTAIAVLIITCPCALALAVPVVQVVAGGRLLRSGVLTKTGDALERLAQVDTVVFDKTGTMSTGAFRLADADRVADADLRLAAGLARASTHPLSRAVVQAADRRSGGCCSDRPAARSVAVEAIEEVAGAGLVGRVPEGVVRLGSRAWVGLTDAECSAGPDQPDGPEIWLQRPDGTQARFAFADTPRPDAAATVSALRARGLRVELLSGDRSGPVARLAAQLGIEHWSAETSPAGKIARLEALVGEGRRVLMVGDGLNDAAALAAAHVSLAPSSAADVSQMAADFVSLGDRLTAVPEALTVARRAHSLVIQNFGLAFAYNAVAIPLAMAGFVTPLVAAVAMSASSIAVSLNALRLHAGAQALRADGRLERTTALSAPADADSVAV